MIGRIRKELEEATADRQGIRLELHIDRLIGSTINQVLFGHAFGDVSGFREGYVGSGTFCLNEL